MLQIISKFPESSRKWLQVARGQTADDFCGSSTVRPLNDPWLVAKTSSPRSKPSRRIMYTPDLPYPRVMLTIGSRYKVMPAIPAFLRKLPAPEPDLFGVIRGLDASSFAQGDGVLGSLLLDLLLSYRAALAQYVLIKVSLQLLFLPSDCKFWPLPGNPHCVQVLLSLGHAPPGSRCLVLSFRVSCSSTSRAQSGECVSLLLGRARRRAAQQSS